MQVPHIDLRLPESVICDLLHEACTSSGFFVIKNHGISPGLRADVLQKCQQFFSLPEDKKLKQKTDELYLVRMTIKD